MKTPPMCFPSQQQLDAPRGRAMGRFHEFEFALLNYLKLQLAQKSITLITKSKRMNLKVRGNSYAYLI